MGIFRKLALLALTATMLISCGSDDTQDTGLGISSNGTYYSQQSGRYLQIQNGSQVYIGTQLGQLQFGGTISGSTIIGSNGTALASIRNNSGNCILVQGIVNNQPVGSQSSYCSTGNTGF